MKKTAAILFFSILFINWFGYRFVIDFFQQEHTRQLEVSLDQEEYDESELISVKAPYPLPYLVSSAEFERWDGEVNMDGILYKYVKRRFINDSIEFLCIPDRKSMQLQTARDNFFRLANDLQQNQPNKKSEQSTTTSFNNLLNYCEELRSWDFSLNQSRLLHYSFYPSYHTGSYADSPGQPPDVC